MANVTVVMSGDDAKLFKSYAKLIKKENEMAAGLKNVGRAGKGAGKDVERSFGGATLGNMRSFIASAATATAGIGLMKSALAHMGEEARSALSDLEKLTAGNIALNQIATSGKDLTGIQNQRDKLAREFGVKPEVVQEILFSARSEGFEETVDEILAARQLVDPRASSKLAGQVPELFKGGITSEEAINANIAAAKESRLKFEEIGGTIPSVAEGASPAGSSPAESFALASVFASLFASGETSADRLKGFGSKIAIDPKLKGKGIIGGFRELQAMPEEERRKWLGENMELNAVYNRLEEVVDQVEERKKKIEAAIAATGTPRAELQKGIARAESNKEFQAQMKLDRARIAEEIARRDELGEGGAEKEAAGAETRASMFTADVSGAGRFAAAKAIDTAKFFRADAEQVRGAGLGAASFTETALSAPGDLLNPVKLFYRAFQEARRIQSGEERPEESGLPAFMIPSGVLPDLTPEQRSSLAGSLGGVRDVPLDELPTSKAAMKSAAEQMRGRPAGGLEPSQSPSPIDQATRDRSAATSLEASYIFRDAVGMMAELMQRSAGSARTPHRPSSRPAALAQRNAHRE